MRTSTYNKEHAQRDRGAALVEYAFLLVLIVVVCIGAVTFLGNATQSSHTRSANSIVAAN